MKKPLKEILMNTVSASPVDPGGEASPPATGANGLVWDLPVRLFHWLMVFGFAGTWLTAESERWRLLHITLGYTVAGLVVFRLLWGLAGTHHARFANFVRGPHSVVRYIQSILRGKPEHHVGHNPLGALAIIALLALALFVSLTGWAADNEVLDKWAEELHEGMASVMLAIVVIHVVGVIVASWAHRENLVVAMITGHKQRVKGDSIRSSRAGIAALLLAAVLGFWGWQWLEATAVSGPFHSPDATAPDRHRAQDDD
jgi:cytochrome b